MADPFDFSEEDRLLLERMGGGSTPTPELASPLAEEVKKLEQEYRPLLPKAKLMGPQVSSADIGDALQAYMQAYKEFEITVSRPHGISEEKLQKALAEESVRAPQYPYQSYIPIDRPSVGTIRDNLEEQPYLRKIGKANKTLGAIFAAIEEGDDDKAEELIENAPITVFPEQILRPTTVLGIGRAAFSTQLIPVTEGGRAKPFEHRIAHWRKVEQRIRGASKDGQTWTESIKRAMAGSTKMTLEEAQAMGMLREKQDKPFWRPVPIYKGSSIMVAGGFRDLLSRTLIISGAVEHIFAPLLLEGQDLKRFKKELEMSNPTEAMEHIAMSVRLARDRGESNESIREKIKTELGRNILSFSYRDLPKESQFEQPDLELAIAHIERNPELARASQYGQFRRFADMVLKKEDEEDLQRMLNTVPFGQLPPEVYAGTMPSTDKVVERVVDAVDYVIDSQDASGYRGTLDLERTIGGAMLESRVIDGRVQIVEGQVARWMSLLGALTDTVAEIRLPYDIPITPASRDFYYNYGKRSPDSTWFTRLMANIETRDLGFTRHLTDEALMNGYDRGDPWYHMSAILGLGLDFFIPWEKGQFMIASAPVRFGFRGAKTMRQFPVAGYRARAFLAGAAPRTYQRIYKSGKRVSDAARRLTERFDGAPKLDDLTEALAREGEDLLSLEEAWLAESLVPLMGGKSKRFGRAAKKLSFDDAIDQFRTARTPTPWENVADTVEAYIRNKLDTPDGENLYAGLPPKLKDTIRRVMDIVADSRVVEEQLGHHFKESSKLHVALLEIMMKHGDPETAVLRSTQSYIKISEQVADFITDGYIATDEYPVIMGYLETQAIRAALSGKEAFEKVKKPEDFFAGLKVGKLDPAAVIGETGAPIRLAEPPEGALTWQISSKHGLSLNSSQTKQLVRFFKNGDIEELFVAGSTDPRSALRTLMGDAWVDKLYKQFDHKMVESPDGSVLGKVQIPMLTRKGEESLRHALNTFFTRGAGSVDGHMYRYFADFQSRFGVYWTRIAAEAETIGTRLEIRDKFHKIFDPFAILEDDAVAIAANYGESGVLQMGRAYRAPQTVRVRTGVEGLREGAVPAYGRSREYWQIDFHPEYVRQGLGITDDITEISAAELFARSVGYVVGEHFKRQIGSTKLIPLTPRSLVTVERFQSISKAVRARMASVLGETSDKMFNANGKIDGKTHISGVYEFNEMQQARLRVFLRQLSNEPMGKIIPEKLLGVDADLSKVVGEDFLAIAEAMGDIEAGVFSRRTHVSVAIPESLGKSLWIAIRDSVERAGDSSGFIENWRSKLKTAFEVPDELKGVVGPAQREIIDKHLMRLDQAGRDVFRWAAEAMKGNKDITMDMVFEQLRGHLTAPVAVEKVDALMGHQILYPALKAGEVVKKILPRKGYIDLLDEFTDAERARHTARTLAEREAKGTKFVEPEFDEVLIGKGDDITADDWAMEIKEAGSKLDFLLKPTTIAEMQSVVSRTGRGINGLTEELTEAFNVLELYRGKNARKLQNKERMLLGKAIERIRDAMLNRKEQIIERGKKIAIGLAGEPDMSILTNVTDTDLAQLYKSFYTGGKAWEDLLWWLSTQKGREVGLETIKGKRRLPRYRVTEAFLGLMVRMRAYEIMGDMADDMVRYGMPSDLKKFSKPQPLISPSGEIVVSPIDTENLFWQRVKWYVEQELNFSMTKREERLYKIDEVTGEEVLVAKRTRQPQAPGRELFPETYEVRGPTGGVMENPADFRAYSMAQEVIARYGHRYRPEGFELYTFPSGQTGLVPKQLVKEIEGAFNRSASIGTARAGVVPELRADIIGSPIGIEPVMSKTRVAEANVGRAIDFFMTHFPVTMKHMKMGVTSGIMVPNPAYFFGVGMGGMLQMYQGMGAVGAARSIFKHNGMTMAVVSRLWKDGDLAVGNPLLVAKNGTVFTADQITELAHMYGLKSGFIFSEAPQTLAKNMNRLRAKGINKIYWSADEWQRTLIESATAMDNYYRVSVFVDALNRGESAASAAKLARKVAFDYADLTDIEKSWFRNIFMFYSYMRKNMDLFWDTILTNPHRILGQLRVMKGVQNAYIEEDTEIRLFERDYAKARLAIAFRKATVDTHMVDKWMYITPPVPAYDAWGLISELIMALGGDAGAQRYMATQINPWIQAPWVLAGQKEFFYDKDINRYNPVPPFIMHLDDTILVGTFREIFGIVPRPHLDPSRRYVEGEEYGGYWHAENGRLWWLWKNTLQFPFAGRSMDTMAYLDRANLGPMELLANITRSMHEYGVDVGVWEKSKHLTEINKQMGPRTGLTEGDELLGLLGIKPFPIPTTQAAHQKAINRWLMEIGKKRHEKELVQPERMYKRRSKLPR